MLTFRFTARPGATRPEPARAQDDVFRRFFDLIERMERPRPGTHPPAPELKARISRLDETPRRPS